MTLQDQEKLFGRVKQRFPRWADKKCSGYVHGVVDEIQRKEPDAMTVRFAMGHGHQYAEGYLCGFMDARGSDILEHTWTQLLVHKLAFEWWKK